MDKNNNVGLNHDWKWSPFEGDKNEFIDRAGDLIQEYILQSKDEQNSHRQEGFDTWIFPLVQMGQLGVHHDAEVTKRVFAEAPEDSQLKIATGYFNLTSQYMDTLIEESNAQCDILMAHPKANGFLGANGVAGGIPYAYSLIAQKFQSRVERKKQQYRIKLYEYLRSGWTYHAKGLWYYPPKSKYPCLTFIGSPNFGERSVKRDLETQLAVITENQELRKSLQEECEILFKLGLPSGTDRDVPKWVHSFVLLFRNYF